MTDPKTLVSRLENIAEALVETTDFSHFCHTIYEASARIASLEAELAAIKGARDKEPK